MRALKVIILIIVAIVVLLLIIGLFLPKNVHIEGTTTINAPAKIIFNQVNHLQNWANWSPFREEDPDMIESYEGPSEGVGAIYKWTMQGDTGKLTIMESVPYEKIVNDLNFYERGGATGTWTFEETDEGTKVVWSMDIKDLSYPVEVYYGILMDMAMKPYFDKGLSNLKEYCENLPEESMPTEAEVIETTIEATPAIAIKDSSMMADIGDKMYELYNELETFMKENNIEMSAPPYTRYYNWDPEKYIVFEVGFPVEDEIEDQGRIYYTTIPAGNIVTVYHYGSYDSMEPAWLRIDEYIKENEKVVIGAPWEVYLTDPNVEKDTSKWVTQICYPVE